jgi:hypothetical protein
MKGTWFKLLTAVGFKMEELESLNIIKKGTWSGGS